MGATKFECPVHVAEALTKANLRGYSNHDRPKANGRDDRTRDNGRRECAHAVATTQRRAIIHVPARLPLHLAMIA
jgi:hypothetical protein